MIDLDANATTRPWPEVIEIVARVSAEAWGNPGSRHALGRRARRVLEESRESIAAILGARPDELLFTSGGTEAINTALFGLTRGTGTLVHTAGQHPATLEPIRVLQQRGCRGHQLLLDQHGRIDPAAWDLVPWETTKLVTLLLAHNETGVLQDPSHAATECAARGIPWHLDAVQAVGKIPVDFHTLGVTALSFAAHKFHGPRGIGGLLLKKGTVLQPLLFGGHQEAGRRAGTECAALAAGMAQALTIWHAEREARQQQLTKLRDRLQSTLQQRCAPAVVHGESVPRLPNTLNIAFPGVDGEALLVALDLAGVAASLGSACASGSTEPSPILVAMGCPADVYRSSLRLTLSAANSAEEIDRAAVIITATVTRLRNSACYP